MVTMVLTKVSMAKSMSCTLDLPEICPTKIAQPLQARQSVFSWWRDEILLVFLSRYRHFPQMNSCVSTRIMATELLVMNFIPYTDFTSQSKLFLYENDIINFCVCLFKSCHSFWWWLECTSLLQLHVVSTLRCLREAVIIANLLKSSLRFTSEL